ncbi:MAG: YqaJ viral recombinase family protein [Pseudomonadaceae bacterium]|nr:YqaJ viral recombinase family protein [Pseudomonadaceae bacterium]
MKIHTEQQGSQEWLNLRGKFFTASEAPAMMGVSKYQSRTELLALKHTGIAPEVSASTQYIYDKGHAAEAAARVILESAIGEDLFPVVGSEGDLLASMDGMDMLETVLFEHKLWNESLAAQVRAGDLEPHYYWQLEQQLLVSGAEKVIFVCSDGTADNWAQMEYRAVPGRAKQLVDGWVQFKLDLAEFVPAVAAEVVTGNAPDELPALRIEMTGMVTGSNLKEFEASAMAVIGAVKTNLQTDQDFADAKKAVKWCADAESAIEAAKKRALSQTESIEVLFKAMDRVSAFARETRLKVDKMVKAQELSIKVEIKQMAEATFATRVATINARLGRVTLPAIAADFAGAMKSKRNLASIRDAVDSELARVKIEANAIAEVIDANLATLRELAANHVFLFRDAQQIVTKANDDFVLLVKARISEHDLEVKRAADQKIEDDRIEAERVEAVRVAEEARIAALPVAIDAPVSEPVAVQAEPVSAPAATPTAAPVSAVQASVSAPAANQPVAANVAAYAASNRITIVLDGVTDPIGLGMMAFGGRVVSAFNFDCSDYMPEDAA